MSISVKNTFGRWLLAIGFYSNSAPLRFCGNNFFLFLFVPELGMNVRAG
jgi:hypothetical protein